METKNTIQVVASLMVLLGISGNPTEIESAVQNIRAGLNMTLFVDKCQGENPKSYITPLDACFSPEAMFPQDPSWSGYDTLDVVTFVSDELSLKRTIFESKDGTCQNNGGKGNGEFEIPVNVCVGPFGKPRPWGKFELVQDGHDKFGDTDWSQPSTIDR